jgi:ABC-type cobalamin/Fe3+-siderophores transport system ATPase subunit
VVIDTHDSISRRVTAPACVLHRGEIVATTDRKILNAELIRSVYGVEVEVGRRADGQTPYLLPLNGGF